MPQHWIWHQMLNHGNWDFSISDAPQPPIKIGGPIHSFIHSFIPQTFIEYLLYTKSHPSNEQNSLWPQEAYSVMVETKNIMSNTDKGNGIKWSRERDHCDRVCGYFRRQHNTVKWRRLLWGVHTWADTWIESMCHTSYSGKREFQGKKNKSKHKSSEAGQAWNVHRITGKQVW